MRNLSLIIQILKEIIGQATDDEEKSQTTSNSANIASYSLA